MSQQIWSRGVAGWLFELCKRMERDAMQWDILADNGFEQGYSMAAHIRARIKEIDAAATRLHAAKCMLLDEVKA